MNKPCSKEWFEKNRKILFYGILVCLYGMIFIYNFLTPYLSDDYSYKQVVDQAGSVFDLFVQEYQHYLDHSGRNVVHLIDRFFLYQNKMIFNVFNSAAFVGIILLMYVNVEKKKKHDIWLLLSFVVLMWFKAVAFAQTILWETGACNYLWGSLIILGFVTFYRYQLKREADNIQTGKETKMTQQVLKAIGFLICGLIAGWCNENTSGGGFLLCVIFLFFFLMENVPVGEKKIKGIRPWMITGLIGECIGMLIMVTSPGEISRTQYLNEEHTGLFGKVARFQKITLAVKEEFFLLLAIWIGAFILCRVQQKTMAQMRTSLCFLFAFVATCYALIATAPPQPRAYFGAGIFLMIALMNMLALADDKQELIRTAKLSVVAIMLLLLCINYLDDGANLYRIKRDMAERENYILEQKAQGMRHMTVAKMRPDFMTKYSDAFECDLEYETQYWTNVGYTGYYDLNYIRAVPREEWEEMMGYNTDEE